MATVSVHIEVITNRQISGILFPFIDACAVGGGETAQKTGREYIIAFL